MTTGERQSGGLSTDIIVYVVLLAMAGLQIILAYNSSGGRELLARMIVVAAVQALVAVMFFMHLWWERRSLVVSIAVVSLFVLFALQYSWSDSFRLLHMSPWAH
ncbi:MAG TPA: cytochrome C oxidase subunit IV family protein [Terriglobales bacterium]|nr:cytochrome C oxidase subunit IV family protein [Terriglobales bacterium]